MTGAVTAVAPEFSRPVAVAGIEAGRAASVAIEASSAEREALAARLRIPGLLRLACRFTLRPEPGKGEQGRIVAEGRLEARVAQTCVVSLEPFEADVVEDFVIHFTAGSLPDEADDDPLAPDEVPYDGTTIDLGEAAAEQLALALDPFPRRPGAVLPADDAGDGPANPFAALAGLKRH